MRVDEGVLASAGGWLGVVDAAQHHRTVCVTAEPVVASLRVTRRLGGTASVGALGRVELLGDVLADREREDHVRALEHGVDAFVLLGGAVNTATRARGAETDGGQEERPRTRAGLRQLCIDGRVLAA